MDDLPSLLSTPHEIPLPLSRSTSTSQQFPLTPSPTPSPEPEDDFRDCSPFPELSSSEPSDHTHRLHRERSPDSLVSEDDYAASPIDQKQPPSIARTPRHIQILPFSLWQYLKQEISITELDGSQEHKSERISNFMAVPGYVEKMILFGFCVCLDSFLYNFTILPLRVANGLYQLCSNYLSSRRPRKSLPVSLKCDLAKGGILLTTCITLHYITDASQMYHSVRGQDVVKLYVIFNVLEIADRLCCSLGQDLLDSLCSRATLGRREDGTQPRIRPAALFAMSSLYNILHTLVLFYQLVSLNVAINSYSNALLTLLMSNQFVEIKGAVFKKFEKENLFQMSCADIVERFQLSLMLCIIALRNLIEISGSTFSLLPASFIPVMPSMSVLQTIFSPVLIVLISEMLVDWLKHAFITKFNHIRPQVYGRFIDILSKDLVSLSPTHTSAPFVDQSPSVARRLGFAALPLSCLFIRVTFQALEMLSDTSHIDECAPPSSHNSLFGPSSSVSYLVIGIMLTIAWAGLVVLKLLIGLNLRAYAASRYSTMSLRVHEDQLNDRNRPFIGTNDTEKTNEKFVRQFLDSKDLNAPGRFDKGLESQGKGDFESLTRFTMVKSRLY